MAHRTPEPPHPQPFPPGAVTLRPLRAEDAPNIRRWMTDVELVSLTVLVPGPEHAMTGVNTPEAVDRYIEALLNDRKRLSFAICVEGSHVGNVGLKNVEEGRVDAECFIEVGERELRGRGVGRQAMQLLMAHCFTALNLRALELTVFDFNAPAIRMYSALGFRLTGRVGWHWQRGVYHPVLGMRLDNPSRRR